MIALSSSSILALRTYAIYDKSKKVGPFHSARTFEISLSRVLLPGPGCYCYPFGSGDGYADLGEFEAHISYSVTLNAIIGCHDTHL